MAQTATIYNFEVGVSNVDRGVYEEIKLQVARHPSETLSYLLTRVIAYCLEYREGISFSKGLADSDEPAIWAHDLTGNITLWLEVGTPSPERLHRANKLGAQVVVYCHKDLDTFMTQLQREEIFGAHKIEINGISSDFLSALEPEIEKRNKLSVSLSDQMLYVTIGGKNFEGTVTSRRLE